MKNKLSAYFQLARFHQPAGWLLLMWPCWFAIILVSPESEVIKFLLLFMLGAISMRSAGCVINDMWDKDIDSQVERTKNRPLANGTLSITEASVLLFLLLNIGLIVFWQLNYDAKLLSLGGFALAIIYPLMKRFFPYPQLFLGIAFNSGAIIAFMAASNKIDISTVFLYVGCVFWTLGYDTIYAHQDKKDDLKAKVKSSAISFGKFNKPIIFICFTLTYSFICAAAYMNNLHNIAAFLAPAHVHMTYSLIRVKLDNPTDCMKKFKSIAYNTGFLIFIGLCLAKIS